MAVSRVAIAATVMLSASHAKYMDCHSAPLCGLLVLESGQGTGNYHHEETAVHGLWPQNGRYGSSQCIKPKDTTPAKELPSCYKVAEALKDPEHQIEFVEHEWTKHGVCAGADDFVDFFGQVCTLSEAPLAVMENVKAKGGSFSDMVQAVKQAGYPVFEQGGEDYQIQLSACAGDDHRWKIANISDFSKVCAESTKEKAEQPQIKAALLV